jgi:hypothetical protein
MNNEFVRIWKQETVPYCEYNLGTHLEKLRKMTKMLYKDRIDYLQNVKVYSH